MRSKIPTARSVRGRAFGFSPVLLVIMLMQLAASVRAEWQFQEDPANRSRVAFVTANGVDSSGKPFRATLLLHCLTDRPRANHAISRSPSAMELCVQDFQSIKAFDFEAFEGPDAKAAGRKLLQIEIAGDKGKVVEKFAVSGWINRLAWLLERRKTGVEEKPDAGPHDFTFGIGNVTKEQARYLRIASAIRDPSTTAIMLRLQEVDHPERTLRIEIPRKGATEALEKLLH